MPAFQWASWKIGLIALERRPHLTNSVLDDPRVSDKEWAAREGMVAFAGYPLLVEDQLMGVVAIFARKPQNEETLQALGSVAHGIAWAFSASAPKNRTQPGHGSSRGGQPSKKSIFGQYESRAADSIKRRDPVQRTLTRKRRAAAQYEYLPGFAKLAPPVSACCRSSTIFSTCRRSRQERWSCIRDSSTSSLWCRRLLTSPVLYWI